MKDSLEPLEPELDALLDRERTAAPPSDALERVRSRLAGSVSGPRDQAGETSKVHGTGTFSLSTKVLVLVALALGGAIGAGLHAVLRPAPAERLIVVERPSPPIATAAVAPTVAEMPGSVPSIAPPAPTSTMARRRQNSGVPSVSSLVAERETLDRARDALARGDAAHALAFIDDHVRMFPGPQLTEEREALAVQALVIAGRYTEARARAAQFRATWPSSLFLPAVEASLESIP